MMRLKIVCVRTAFVLPSALLGADLPVAAEAVVDGGSRFYAAQCAAVAGKTWGLLDRDGANRPTEPYLSSLVGGEAQTGSIGSPPFVLSVEKIRFTIRGHDGREGGRDENFLVLLDNKTGNTLRKTHAPGNDALQEREWDVADLKGRTVRIAAVDGNSAGAFAWLGVGQIEAGAEMTIDFRQGIPDGWKTAAKPDDGKGRERIVVDNGPVPFQVYEDTYTWIPENGVGEVAIGTTVRRLFFLGCTVSSNRVLQTYGHVDIVYADDSKETYPLVYGFTLEGAYKIPSRGKASHVLPVGDGTQYLLGIRPAHRVIRKIVLRRAAPDLPRPRISAVTCELEQASALALDAVDAADSVLERLAPARATPDDDAWLAGHILSADGPKWQTFAGEIRRLRGIPTTLSEIQRGEEPPLARFDRLKVSDKPFEAASVCDIDKDGRKDIVSGNHWYAGPDFTKVYTFRSLKPTSGYHDSFHDFPMDVNGDGYVDIVSGGWFAATLLWCQNPGGRRVSTEWTVHEIDKPGSIETSRFWDVTGDGHLEIVPNAGGNVVFYRLLRDDEGKGTGRFEKHEVKRGGCGHGLGFGDVNGDGRSDFVIPDGWLEAPKDPLGNEWTFHPEFQLGGASVPILTHDVNEDGLTDIIYGNAHGYGLYWLRQTSDDKGKRTWKRQGIDESASQYHDMMLADIDGDKRLELITGKRYRAHNGHDPVFVRYFDMDRKGIFLPHTIDYGAADTASGVGILFWVEDVTGNGRLDIVAPGKEGLYLFKNR